MALIVSVVGAAIVIFAIAQAQAGAATGPPDAWSAPNGTSLELSYETEFLQLINDERALEGMGPLAVYDDIQDDARLQAAAIRDAGYLFHNPDLANVTSGWYALGENVGYGPTVQLLHDAFMGSPGHRANVLKADYNYGAAGVVIDENDVIWVAIVFLHGPDGLPGSTPVVVAEDTFEPPFRDDEGSVHESAINAIAQHGITTGCDAAAELYCPDDPVTRGQMATFLARGLELPVEPVDQFVDDASNAHEAAINSMAAAGITLGCGDGRFCPDETVTRGQMATFLARGLDLPAAPTDYFDDDDGTAHEWAINALAFSGITGGCENRAFCPEADVTRAQMATFLARALDFD